MTLQVHYHPNSTGYWLYFDESQFEWHVVEIILFRNRETTCFTPGSDVAIEAWSLSNTWVKLKTPIMCDHCCAGGVVCEQRTASEEITREVCDRCSGSGLKGWV